MIRLRSAIAALAVLVCVPTLASAQAKQGDKEFLVFANFNSIVGGGNGANGNGTIFLNVGKFFTDTQEVGGGPLLTISAGGGNGFSTTVGANGFYRYYMKTKNPKLSPYFGGEGSCLDFSDFSNQFFVNGIVGLKDYLSQKAAIDIKGAVGFNPSTPSLVLISVTAGLTFVF